MTHVTGCVLPTTTDSETSTNTKHCIVGKQIQNIQLDVPTG